MTLRSGPLSRRISGELLPVCAVVWPVAGSMGSRISMACPTTSRVSVPAPVSSR